MVPGSIRLRGWLTRRLLAAATVFVIGFGVYAASLGNGFAYDDVAVVQGDDRVKQFLIGPIFRNPYWATPGFALYRPLVTLSFAVDWAISNGDAAWFHAVNSLWHALASVTVFALLLAWFKTGPSLMGGLLFAVHPVHVEAVANVVGRAELMATALLVAACACWAHGWPRQRVARTVTVVVLFALATLCKESAVVLPGLLVLIDAARGEWKSFRDLPSYVRWRAPELLALTLVVFGALVLRTAVAGALAPTELDPVMEVLRSTGDRVRSALQIWPHFVRLMFFPVTLLADYAPRVLMPADGWTASALLGLTILATLLLTGLLLLQRGRGLAALTLLWFPVAVLPVANLVVPIGVLLAERTLYLPSIAICFAAAALAALVAAQELRVQRALLAASVVVLALLALRTNLRIPDWDSTDQILLAQLRDRPDSFRAHWHAARIERRANRVQAALARYSQAVQLWPFRERLIVESSAYAASQSQSRIAYRLAAFGVQRWPRNLQLQRLLASNALDLGDTVTARRAMLAGLKLAPNDDLLRRMSATLAPEKSAR